MFPLSLSVVDISHVKQMALKYFICLENDPLRKSWLRSRVQGAESIEYLFPQPPSSLYPG